MTLRNFLFVPMMASALFGCSSGQSAAAPEPAPEGKTGSLEFALTGIDSAGVPYRLRNATFDIYGTDVSPYPYDPYYGAGGASAGGATNGSFDGGVPIFAGGTTSTGGATSAAGAAGSPSPGGAPGGDTSSYREVSSETDPDSATITTRLVPGDYAVNLENDDWYLEKITPGGAERVAESVLLSDRTQYAYVWDQSTTAVVYRFGVDGQLIDFRHGDLNVDIQIEHPGESDVSAGGAPSWELGGAPSAGGATSPGAFIGAGGFVGAGGAF